MARSNNTEQFEAFMVGTSPAGVDYWARKPGDEAKLRRSLTRQWARARKVKLSRGGVEAVLDRDDHERPHGRIGATYVQGSSDFLQWCEDAVALRLDHVEAEGVDDMLNADCSSEMDRLSFYEAANRRRVQALRKQLRRLERANGNA